MSNDQDLFAEEQSMATMSFGEHIEELRVRLILALIGYSSACSWFSFRRSTSAGGS